MYSAYPIHVVYHIAIWRTFYIPYNEKYHIRRNTYNNKLIMTNSYEFSIYETIRYRQIYSQLLVTFENLVWGFRSTLYHKRWKDANFNLCTRHSWLLRRESSLACHIKYNTRHKFISSYLRTRFTHTCFRAFGSEAVPICFNDFGFRTSALESTATSPQPYGF